MRARLLLGAAFGLALPFVACSDRERPGPPGGIPGTGATGGVPIFDLEGGYDGPPPLDASGFCGNQLHGAIANAPNIYFVLDASGSMDQSAPGTGKSRYEAVRLAIRDLIIELGPLIKTGAAVFPPESSQFICAPGEEVFPPQQGDAAGEYGDVAAGYLKATNLEPFGGTPIAATLQTLIPTLSALEGTTVVVLATDGGPNCNPNAQCAIDECMLNVEGACSPPSVNCCDPSVLQDGPLNCVDRAATLQAIEAINDIGIDVVVIGIPGSELYTTTLTQMAIVGGAATPNAPFYYDVQDLTNLTEVLGDIASVVVSCEFDLEDPPEELGMTNVYLDQEVLPFDEANGWSWQDEDTVVLNGSACASLKNGEIGAVQIVSGCPTETPK